MNVTAFLADIAKMVALRPDIIKRLTELAPRMSDEQRKEMFDELQNSYQTIAESNAEIVKVMDAGIADLTKMQKKVVHVIRDDQEQQEHSSADAILNKALSDDSGTPFFA